MKLVEPLGYDFRVRQICLGSLVQEGTDAGGESDAQRISLDRGGEGCVENGESVGWKRVVASRLHRHQTAMQAREREGVVAHGGNIVLGLPDKAALDARPRVERVDDAPPEDVARDCRRGNEKGSRRAPTLGLTYGRRAEKKPEPWTRGTKLSRRRERKVELKRVRQQEHAVDGRIALEIDELYRAELINERRRPIIENVGDRDVVGDGESEIQVGETITLVDSERAHGGSGYDAVVLLREPEHALAERIPLLDGEHEERS